MNEYFGRKAMGWSVMFYNSLSEFTPHWVDFTKKITRCYKTIHLLRIDTGGPDAVSVEFVQIPGQALPGDAQHACGSGLVVVAQLKGLLDQIGEGFFDGGQAVRVISGPQVVQYRNTGNTGPLPAFPCSSDVEIF